jgi:phage terminase large subunit GpA-like protein
LINQSYRHASGITLPLSMVAIDTGYATQEVYNWVRQQSPTKIMAIKGASSSTLPLSPPRAIDITLQGRRLKRGIKIWSVGVSLLKSELYHSLTLKKGEDGYPAGYCHFPKYSPEYFKQLTAEQLVTTSVKGYPKRDWQKIRERNEALDCRIYARAAAIALGMDRWTPKQWEKVKEQISLKKNEDARTRQDAGTLPPYRSKLTTSPRRRVIYSDWMQR